MAGKGVDMRDCMYEVWFEITQRKRKEILEKYKESGKDVNK